MNGELFQACQLTSAVKAALSGRTFAYQGAAYEKTLRFLFLTGSAADGAVAWYRSLRERGLSDIKLLSPTTVEDRNRLGFSNGVASWIVCFYRDGMVTHWQARWEFDSVQKGWQIEYLEARYENAPSGKPRFEDHTEEFCAVLAKIQALAEQLDEPGFASCFAEARRMLTEKDWSRPFQTGLPDRNARLLGAAVKSWVFGGMCSWNDSPPYEAQNKGLDEEYERLSAELHRQIMLAALYAVNEWPIK